MVRIFLLYRSIFLLFPAKNETDRKRRKANYFELSKIHNIEWLVVSPDPTTIYIDHGLNPLKIKKLDLHQFCFDVDDPSTNFTQFLGFKNILQILGTWEGLHNKG